MHAAGPSRKHQPSSTRRSFVAALSLIATIGACDHESKPTTSAPTTQRTAHPVERTAEKGPLKVTVRVDRDEVVDDQPLKLTVLVEAQQGVKVSVPKIEGIIGEFEVKSSSDRTPPCDSYNQCKEWTYELVGVIPGNGKIPALPFGFEDDREKANGWKKSYKDQIETEPIDVKIEHSLADLKGPIGLPIAYQYQLLWWALGVIAVVAIIAIMVRRFRKRSPEGAAMVAVAKPAEPPHIWALRELDRLAAEQLIERGLIREYFFRINALLRRYIELRFGFMAGEQTSEEFIRALQDAFVLNDVQKSVLQRFVAACDPVKYARQEPMPDDIAWVGRCAREFVVQTVPVANPQGAADMASRPTHEEAAA